ncbi:MAG: 2-oxoacid:ferredoxin oxidoreductase subunit beta, partial [Desulfobacula sp.]|nr:2-oxoacid:ferredoxin oxidoreductase subunit beta [Desulfobacula sp.]
ARGYAGNPLGLKQIIKEATLHKGFSFVQILTPCVTFDKENKTWKNLKENVYDLKPGIEEKNMETAMRIAREEPYGVGIIFQDKRRPHYQEILRNLNKAD